MITQEYLDKVDEKLSGLCAAGYALGLIGEANIRYMTEQYPDFIWRQRVYRLGDIACLKWGMIDDYDADMIETLLEVESVLDEAGEYPILDDDTFSEVQVEAEVEWVEEFARDNEVSTELVWKALEKLDVYFEWEQEYVYPANAEVEDIIREARALGNTWSAHYGFSDDAIYHYPESCWYCVRAEEVA